MRALREETRELVEQLYAGEPSSARLSEVIWRIGQLGDVMAVPRLLSYALRPRIMVEAAVAISSLMEQASDKELLHLHEIRSLGSLYGHPGQRYREWANLTADRVVDLDYGAEQSVWLLGLASFHRSGYVREVAVKRLARRSERQALPFLLLRANDWVKQVRERAQAALELKLQVGPVAHFASALPFLARLARGQRADHSPFVHKVREALANEPGLGGLKEAAKSRDRYVRRAVFQLIWTRDDRTVQPYLESALADEDILVRVEAARRASRSAEPTKWLDAFGSDRAAAVRSVVVEHLGGQGLESALAGFLLDQNAGVRRDARFFLGKQGWDDFAPHYRQALSQADPRQLRAAILGLGEVGSREDADRVRNLLSAELVRVRRAAVVAVGKLDAGEDSGIFLRAIQDPAPSVSHAARDVLLTGQRVIDLRRLVELTTTDTPSHVRRNAIQLLLGKSGRWSAISHLIELAEHPSEEIREDALNAIDRWLAKAWRNFIRPTSAEAAHLRSRLESAAGTLEGRGKAISNILAERNR